MWGEVMSDTWMSRYKLLLKEFTIEHWAWSVLLMP